MAGDWIKMETALPDKPEVWQMAGILSIDPDAVIGKLLRVWAWFDSHTTDGNAVGVTYALLDRIAGVTGFAEAMTFCGWLNESGSCLSVPNFSRHNGKTAKNRALTNDRVAKSREMQRGSNAECNANTVTKTVTREEKRREDINTLSDKSDDAGEIISYLNAKTKSSYRNVDSNSRMIVARLKEGATVDQVKAVIDAKVAQWGKDPKMSEYLRPSTLFNATKFNDYLGQLGGSTSAGGVVDSRPDFMRGAL